MFTATGRTGTEAQRFLLFDHKSSLCLCVSVATCLFTVWLSHPRAQTLIDRVVARVDAVPITLTDVQAAIGLGIVQVAGGGDAIAAGTQQMIDRQLELAEVQRFPPPAPPPAMVAMEVARLKMNAGSRLPALMQSTGLVEVSDEEVANYYRTHAAEFTQGGDTLPFDEAEPIARQRVSVERRRATIRQWVTDLRARADVSVNPPITNQ